MKFNLTLLASVFAAGVTLLAPMSSAQAACKFTDSSTDTIREVVKKNGGWPLSDANCAILLANKLALDVTGQASVLDGVSVGWASVKLVDINLNIGSDAVRMSTTVRTNAASQPVADTMMYQSIESALGTFDFAKAAKEVNDYRARARAAQKAGKN